MVLSCFACKKLSSYGRSYHNLNIWITTQHKFASFSIADRVFSTKRLLKFGEFRGERRSRKTEVWLCMDSVHALYYGRTCCIICASRRLVCSISRLSSQWWFVVGERRYRLGTVSQLAHTLPPQCQLRTNRLITHDDYYDDDDCDGAAR